MVKPFTLSEKLHLIVPIYGEDGETPVAYVHSAPISREVFEAHFLLLAKTFSTIHLGGLGAVAGPRVASLLLARVARDQNDEIGALTLMNEIRRLTNVMIRTSNGWEALPYQEVVDRGDVLDPDDLAEVTNSLVFFIVTSSMQRKKDRREMVDGAARLWGAQTSLSGFTAFANSLTTSIAPEPTPKAEVSSQVY